MVVMVFDLSAMMGDRSDVTGGGDRGGWGFHTKTQLIIGLPTFMERVSLSTSCPGCNRHLWLVVNHM